MPSLPGCRASAFTFRTRPIPTNNEKSESRVPQSRAEAPPGSACHPISGNSRGGLLTHKVDHLGLSLAFSNGPQLPCTLMAYKHQAPSQRWSWPLGPQHPSSPRPVLQTHPPPPGPNVPPAHSPLLFWVRTFPSSGGLLALPSPLTPPILTLPREAFSGIPTP